MRKIVGLLLFLFFHFNGLSQDVDSTASDVLLQDLAGNACDCVDSIDLYNKPKEDVIAAISKCIDAQVAAFQLGSKLLKLSDFPEDHNEVDGKKEVTIPIELDKRTDEYKNYYFEMERYLMEHCASLKIKVASLDEQHQKSVSNDSTAIGFYNLGLAEVRKENYQKAIDYFRQALDIDAEYAFAWDNLGLCYRKLENYDLAIQAYQKSLAIDPNGLMPLQNIAVAYQYKKEYKKAIAAYEALALVDKDNPEVYYGIGQVYALNLNDYEHGLENMCKAYNLYIEQKSPYRSDVEKIIGFLFSEMKKQGKQALFYKILKTYHITPQE
jgi:tetratricopeptide (TPR) repeat protein